MAVDDELDLSEVVLSQKDRASRKMDRSMQIVEPSRPSHDRE